MDKEASVRRRNTKKGIANTREQQIAKLVYTIVTWLRRPVEEISGSSEVSGFQSGKRSFVTDRDEFTREERNNINGMSCQSRSQELTTNMYGGREIDLVAILILGFFFNDNAMSYRFSEIISCQPCPDFLKYKISFRSMEPGKAYRVFQGTKRSFYPPSAVV